MKTKRTTTVLVLDDDAAVVSWLEEGLRDEGFEVRGVTRASEALEAVEARAYDVLLSDVEMPDMRGIDLLRAVHQRRASQIVVLMTAFGSIELATSAMRAGASDFITKPFALEALVNTLDRAVRERRMRKEIVRLRNARLDDAPGDLVARSPAMKRALELARRAAETRCSVLVTGPSGAGKGAIASTIHQLSAERAGPFVQVNCAALPGNLVEAELFGVRRGAFTDAREDREGLFRAADGGTLFLDEIGEMALEVQPKLLNVLETGRVRPVGGTSEVPIAVRVVAATNRSLEEALRERRFRADLYHRLNVVRIEVPGLAEREEDIPSLVDRMLARASKRLGRDVIGVSDEAMAHLRARSYPGNVRELANTIERAVALTRHDVLMLADVASSHPGEAPSELLDRAAETELSLEALEREYIRRVLRNVGGNKSRAARILKVDRRTLYRKLPELLGAGDEDE